MRNFILAFWLLIISTQAFAIKPYKDYVGIPSQAGMSYDSLNIFTSDNFRLTSWYCKPVKDKTDLLIVIAGGDAGNMSYDLQLAQLFTQQQLPVLLFDYRGFGSSQSFAYDSNAIGHPEYLTDIDAAVSYTQKHYPGKKIVLYGRSLGASLAIVEGSMSNGLSGVIAESPYASQDTLAKRFEQQNDGRLVRPIVSDKLEPLKNIRNFRVGGLLVLHGANEKYILSNELDALTKLAPISNKKFIDFADCDHLELPFKATQKFGEAMDNFLSSIE